MKVVGVGAPQGTSQSQSDSCSMPRQRVIGLKVEAVRGDSPSPCRLRLCLLCLLSLPVSLHLTLCPCTLRYLHVPQTRFTHLLSVSKRTPPSHSALGLHPHLCTSAVFMQPIYARCTSCQCPCASGACENPILQARMHTHAAGSPPVRGKLPQSVQPTR
jgi:hypothetical protein